MIGEKTNKGKNRSVFLFRSECLLLCKSEHTTLIDDTFYNRTFFVCVPLKAHLRWNISGRKKDFFIRADSAWFDGETAIFAASLPSYREEAHGYIRTKSEGDTIAFS